MLVMVWYFAYGSNLNKKQMLERVGEWKNCKRSVLKNYKMVFNVKSRRWNGYTANIVPDEGSEVVGVVYELDESQIRKMDYFEKGSKVIDVILEAESGKMNAVTYIWNREGSFEPPERYKETILEGIEQHDLNR